MDNLSSIEITPNYRQQALPPQAEAEPLSSSVQVAQEALTSSPTRADSEVMRTSQQLSGDAKVQLPSYAELRAANAQAKDKQFFYGSLSALGGLFFGAVTFGCTFYHHPLLGLATLCGVVGYMEFSMRKAAEVTNKSSDDREVLPVNGWFTPEQCQIIKRCFVESQDYVVHCDRERHVWVIAKMAPEAQSQTDKLTKMHILQRYLEGEKKLDHQACRALEVLIGEIEKELPPDSSLAKLQQTRLGLAFMQRLDPKLSEKMQVADNRQPWDELFRFYTSSDLPRYEGHRWNCDTDGTPVLVMPTGYQRWEDLKAAGLNLTDDGRIPEGWAYTERGFVQEASD